MIYDLHSHTTGSDGKLTSKELINLAIKNKLKIIAITDHDNVESINEAIKYSKDKGIEVVPGIEISCDTEGLVKELHIVGLFIDYKNLEFKKIKNQAKKNSRQTAIKILNELKRFGYKLNIKDLDEKDHYGRPFISEMLIEKYPREFPDRKTVFDEYLGAKGKIKIAPIGPNLKNAIKVIHNAGGVAILAHPGYLREHDDYFIQKFIDSSGDGIEVECGYSSFENNKELRRKYRKVAEKHNLLISGGTDFHYEKEDKSLGDLGVNKEEFSKIKESLK